MRGARLVYGAYYPFRMALGARGEPVAMTAASNSASIHPRKAWLVSREIKMKKAGAIAASIATAALLAAGAAGLAHLVLHPGDAVEQASAEEDASAAVGARQQGAARGDSAASDSSAPRPRRSVAPRAARDDDDEDDGDDD